MEPHRCDERCSCPVDGKPLFYSRSTGEHACMDPDCVNAHGLPTPTLPRATIDVTWEAEEMNRKITEALRSFVQEGVCGSIEFKAPPVTIESVMETMSSVEMVTEEIRRRQREDMRRVEEAYVRALELDQGVFIVTRQGRVIHADPSPYVPARTAYWANADAWVEVDVNDLFSGRFAPNMD